MSDVVNNQRNAPEESSSENTTSRTSFMEVLRLRNFRLLWIGEGISVLGDQFFLIALPWLVLQLTGGDALATGTVLAVAGIPRALFVLIGGVLTDRVSPHRVMFVSNVLRGALVALLAVLILVETIDLWMLYGFALLFGLTDAFFFPAASAMVPQLVEERQLQSANAIIQGTIQISLLLGPALAGVIIALLGETPEAVVVERTTAEVVPAMDGIGIAFAADALTFLVSVITLGMMRIDHEEAKQKAQEVEGVLSSIREGLASVWNDKTMRAIFILIVAINFFFSGPIIVGIPVLADTRLPEGAAAFGIVFSMIGGGSLVGTVLVGVLPKPNPKHIGVMLMILISIQGACLGLMGFVYSTAVATGLAAIMGIASGYSNIFFITWIQSRTAPDMMGRIMSVLMFASMGVGPVTIALSGVLIELNVTAFLAICGSLTVVMCLLFALDPAIQTMGLEIRDLERVSVTEAFRTTTETPIAGAVRVTGETQAIRATAEMRSLITGEIPAVET